MKNSKYKVTMCTFKDLPDNVKESQPDNGYLGKEYADYLIVKHNNKIIRIESDAMAQEDTTFKRDLKWVIEALEEAYNLGFRDGNGDKK